MKRILIALALVACLSPFISKTRADAEVSLDFFYDNLSPYGSWIDVGDYGYCFQPNVAVNNSDWRPYSDGYWAYTDVGWTWVSYEDFGWATYHYGRWANLESYGWVWMPGYEWGPAWVSWRTGGDYVGWAPLPPQRETVYEGRPITGAVDVTFDIGPLYYNFVDIRYIGEPVLRQRIVPLQRNVTIINRTVNVTNITYNNSVVYNYGPNFSRLNQYSERQVPRLAIKRETNVSGYSVATHGGNLNRVNNGQLMVVAPSVRKSEQKIAPKQVKTTVARPTVERGWKGINNRQQLQAEMKKENPKNVPPPSFSPPANNNGVSANGKEGSRQGGMAAPTPLSQSNTPDADTQEAAAPSRAAERARQENAAAGHRPARGMATSTPPTPQRDTPAADTQGTLVPGQSERTQQENAATAHSPRPSPGQVENVQSRPDERRTEATPSHHPTREPEVAQPVHRSTPFARPRRARPTEPSNPSNPNNGGATQEQPAPGPRHPQPAPAESRPSAETHPHHHGEAQHPAAETHPQHEEQAQDSASPPNVEHQGKPKKKRPNPEQTPHP